MLQAHATMATSGTEQTERHPRHGWLLLIPLLVFLFWLIEQAVMGG